MKYVKEKDLILVGFNDGFLEGYKLSSKKAMFKLRLRENDNYINSIAFIKKIYSSFNKKEYNDKVNLFFEEKGIITKNQIENIRKAIGELLKNIKKNTYLHSSS